MRALENTGGRERERKRKRRKLTTEPTQVLCGLGLLDGMVRFKHRYLVASVAATPEVLTELGPKEITAMLKVNLLLLYYVRLLCTSCACCVLSGVCASAEAVLKHVVARAHAGH